MEISEIQAQFLLMRQTLHLLAMILVMPLSYITYKVFKNIATLCEEIGPLLLFVFAGIIIAWVGITINTICGIESILAPNIYLNEHYRASKYEYGM